MRLAGVGLLPLILMGCDPAPLQVDQGTSDLLSNNLLSSNSLKWNALTNNPLTASALIENPLTKSALEGNPQTAQALSVGDGTIDNGEDARTVLQYIYSCAAPVGAAMSLELDGETYDFAGSLGLAANWLVGTCDGDCQRWVSACLAARVNYFDDVSVPLSLRGTHPNLTTSGTELSDYPWYEASFWGDVFGPDPVPWVCAGTNQDQGPPRLRVCADPDSPCGFNWAGNCNSCTGANCPVASNRPIEVYLHR
jgi:hypothetical protein